MQSRALYLLATSGCLNRIVAFQSSSIGIYRPFHHHYCRWLSSAATSSLTVIRSMSHCLAATTTTTTLTAVTVSSSLSSSLSGVTDCKDLFQFSDPSNPPSISSFGGDSNDERDVLLQRRPFVIVEGRVVRDDIVRSLEQQLAPSISSISSSPSSPSEQSIDGKDNNPLSPLSRSSDNFTSKQFLTSFPSGAYTTSRTVEARRVLRLDQHLSRMAESARLMITAELQNGDTDSKDAIKAVQKPSLSSSWQSDFLTEGTRISPADASDGSADGPIKALVQKSLAAGIASFEHLHPASTDIEKRITTLLFWEEWAAARDDGDGGGDLRLRALSYVELLPPPPAGRIIAQLSRTQRANALAKDSRWVTDRRALERQKIPTDPPVHEVLLTTQKEGHGDSGSHQLAVLEGLSSNFFAITRGGVVYTAAASEGVLLGTLRAIVIRVCEENNIEVVEEAPPLPSSFDGDVCEHGWVGAFVSSTTRLALPVTDLIVPSSTTAADAGDGTVDIVHFSYKGLDGHDDDDDDDGRNGDAHVGRSLGILMEDGKGDTIVEEKDSNKSYKVGKCIPVDDSRGIMKTIVEGVHAAVLSESDRPW